MASLQKIFLNDDVTSFAGLLRRFEDQQARQRIDFFDTPIPKHEPSLRMDPASEDSAIVSVIISKPLLLMFMHGARRCCKFTVNSLSFQDLQRVREDAGNLLHALVIGCQAKLRPASTYHSVLTDVLNSLSEEELRSLNAWPGHLSLRPVELAVRLNEFRMAERLLCNGVLQRVSSTVQGPRVVVTYDLGEYSANALNSRFLVSPLTLLGENVTIERLRAIKESNIFRSHSIFHAWEALTTRNVQLSSLQIVIMMTIVLFLTIYSGHSFTRKRIATACNYPRASSPTWADEALEIIGMTLCTFVGIGSLFSFTSLYKWIRFLKKVNYKVSFYRIQFFTIVLHYTIPSFLVVTGCGVWIYVICQPDLFCDRSVYYSVVSMIVVIYLAILYMTVYDLQVVTFVSQFVSNFFDILSQFIPFIILYVLITIVFARIFQNISDLQMRNFNESRQNMCLTDSQMFRDYTESIYTTFRLSLNIIDLSRSSTDLMIKVVHWLYVLILPFMIFNYIIGVVSVQLSSMVEVQRVKAIVHRSIVSTSIYVTMDILRKINSCKMLSLKSHLTVNLPMTDNCLCDRVRYQIIDGENKDVLSLENRKTFADDTSV